MPEYIWNIGFAISLLLTSCLCILIARGVFRSGVEHFSSRILIFSGIINTSLCGLLFLSQGIYEAIRIATAEPIHLGQLLVPFIFIAVPVRILWNYFSIQQKPVIVYNLQLCTSVEINTEIATLCKTMGINPPAILFSPLVMSPFVLGRRSNRAILAIPGQWLNTNSRNHYIQLLHELSHIRNHDVGFLAWSGAVLQDLQLLLILLPALAGYCFVIGSSHMVSSILLYLVCSIILFAMLRYIVRKRESLADLTAAMLVESGQVKEVINSQEIYTGVSDISLEQQAKPVVADKTRRWLLDKAMFSKKQKLWKFLLVIFNFFNLLHPDRTDRLNTIASVKNMWDKVQVSSPGGSFWAGISLGLLGVIIGLGGYWLSVFTQNPQDNTEKLSLPFKMYGLAAPAALGFLVIFLTLPYWSSSRNPRLDGNFLFSQLKRHSIALAGAFSVCPLILTAGVFNENIRVLTVLCAVWLVFIVFMGLSISIVSVFLWITIRYFQSDNSADLKFSLLIFAPIITVTVISIISGLALMNRSRTFEGVNLIFSIIMGLVLFLLTLGRSRFSTKDNYCIINFFGLTLPIEGNILKFSNIFIYTLALPVLITSFTLAVYFTIDSAFGSYFKNISIRAGLLFLITYTCAVLIIIRACENLRISQSKRGKIYQLSDCLKIMSKDLNAGILKKIDVVAKNYKISKLKNSNKKQNLTTNDIYEYISLVSGNRLHETFIDNALSWLLKCQGIDGFGLWPGSCPRLYSTYQAFSVLSEKGMLKKINNGRLQLWIKKLQQPDGLFKDPWSKRDTWEQTYYAAKCLSMLDLQIDSTGLKLCKSKIQLILEEKGIRQDRPDIIFFCLGTLDCLNALDEKTVRKPANWLISQIDKLLLTNISLNYESVHFTIMIYQMLYPHARNLIGSESMTLLTERIHIALKAELVDIRIS